uniref:Uncharacterized protein n=1 Tax=Aegilops tauschii subsp. strangulata TaxID=200361 RepID=A0A453EKD7_AEGTS
RGSLSPSKSRGSSIFIPPGPGRAAASLPRTLVSPAGWILGRWVCVAALPNLNLTGRRTEVPSVAAPSLSALSAKLQPPPLATEAQPTAQPDCGLMSRSSSVSEISDKK